MRRAPIAIVPQGAAGRHEELALRKQQRDTLY